MTAVVAGNPSMLRGRLRQDEPMARHTTWRVGGPAQRYYEPADVDDLACFLRSLSPGEPLYWVGLGSNLLVRDGGLPGTVVVTAGLLNRLEQTAAHTIRAEAGVPCPKLARFGVRAGLSGAEFMAGIPGTVGGALAMNAGAFGGETWSILAEVETMDRSGRRHTRGPEDFTVGYRQVTGPVGEWFIAARFRLVAGDARAAEARIRGLLRLRGETQPTGQASCGSVFRNPPGDHAARLIETAGLKGRRIGGAVVSPEHANFIINSGTASAADIEALVTLVADEVERVHGMRLRREFKVVGVAAGVRP